MLKLVIAIFIKFCLYTTFNIKDIIKFSEIAGHKQILYIFVVISIQEQFRQYIINKGCIYAYKDKIL